VGWHAETGFRSIGKGTILTLMFTPHVDGYAPPPLEAGAEISVAFADNSRTKVTAVEVSEECVTIETQDGSLWRMTPRTANDSPFSGVDTGAIPSQDWTIRAAG
jgi:hypothetical protein